MSLDIKEKDKIVTGSVDFALSDFSLEILLCELSKKLVDTLQNQK